MKRIAYLIMMISLVGLFSCKLPTDETQTKDECLDTFFSNAQAGNWNSMYQQIHQDNQYYSQYKSGTLTFSSFMTTSADYTVTARSGSTYSVTCNYTGAGDTPETFVFKEDGSDYWLISSFTSDSGGTSH